MTSRPITFIEREKALPRNVVARTASGGEVLARRLLFLGIVRRRTAGQAFDGYGPRPKLAGLAASAPRRWRGVKGERSRDHQRIEAEKWEMPAVVAAVRRVDSAHGPFTGHLRRCGFDSPFESVSVDQPLVAAAARPCGQGPRA